MEACDGAGQGWCTATTGNIPVIKIMLFEYLPEIKFMATKVQSDRLKTKEE